MKANTKVIVLAIITGNEFIPIQYNSHKKNSKCKHYIHWQRNRFCIFCLYYFNSL